MSQPRRRRLDVEDVGDVTVVRFLDSKILDEQNIQIIGEQLFALVDSQGRRRIALSFANVEYLSSASWGKLITLNKKVQAVRGWIVFCAIHPQILEAWEIPKLDKFFCIRATESQALEELSAGPGNDLFIACPLGGCPGTSRVAASRLGYDVYLRCPECGARFEVLLPEVAPGCEAECPVTVVRLPTYDKQEVRLVPGRPFTLSLGQRLDLFASEAVARLWQSIPPPRFAVIDCRQTTELSERGVAALAALLSGDGGDRAVLLVRKGNPPKGATFPPGMPVHEEEQEALRAIGEVPAEGGHPITVQVTRPRAGS